ncbi:MAG: DUF2842 domain-containing protein [Novosphingobium sp.]|nr:DUF2842 domain-containing protein [Novosphingobium sp.]
MRQEPTWRIPIGILALVLALVVYGLAIANYLGPTITTLPALVQLPVYILLGVVWLLPLRRYLIWMETGRCSAPDKGE